MERRDFIKLSIGLGLASIGTMFSKSGLYDNIDFYYSNNFCKSGDLTCTKPVILSLDTILENPEKWCTDRTNYPIETRGFVDYRGTENFDDNDWNFYRLYTNSDFDGESLLLIEKLLDYPHEGKLHIDKGILYSQYLGNGISEYTINALEVTKL